MDFIQIHGDDPGFEALMAQAAEWIANVVEDLLRKMPPEPTLQSFKEVVDSLTEACSEEDKKKPEYWFVRTPANYVDILLEAQRKIVEVTETDPHYRKFQQKEAGKAGQN